MSARSRAYRPKHDARTGSAARHPRRRCPAAIDGGDLRRDRATDRFFLPGDSLLFAAGLFTAAGVIPLPIGLILAGAAASAVAGDQVGFRIGRRLGPRLFAPGGRRPWSQRHVAAAHDFFERHGHKAVVLARFVPLARTFTPVVAGAVGMPARRFTGYNVVGGLLWTTSMLLAGFFLGGVPLIAAHVELATVALIAVSLIPATAAFLRHRMRPERTVASAPPAPVEREQQVGELVPPSGAHPYREQERRSRRVVVRSRRHGARGCVKRSQGRTRNTLLQLAPTIGTSGNFSNSQENLEILP